MPPVCIPSVSQVGDMTGTNSSISFLYIHIFSTQIKFTSSFHLPNLARSINSHALSNDFTLWGPDKTRRNKKSRKLWKSLWSSTQDFCRYWRLVALLPNVTLSARLAAGTLPSTVFEAIVLMPSSFTRLRHPPSTVLLGPAGAIFK